MPLPSPKPPADIGPVRPAPARRRRVGVLASVLVLLAASALVLTRKPVPPPEAIAYTPRQAQTAQEHVGAVRAQLFAPDAGAGTPHTPTADTDTVQHVHQAHGPDLVRLQLSQADLNAYCATNPQVKAMLANHHVQAMQMLLKPPQGITVRATMVRGGHPYNVQIETTVRADPKIGLQVTATGAQVGRLPLPPALVMAQANKVAGQMTGKMRGRLPLALKDVRVQGDHLVLMGVPRGPMPGGPQALTGGRSRG